MAAVIGTSATLGVPPGNETVTAVADDGGADR